MQLYQFTQRPTKLATSWKTRKCWKWEKRSTNCFRNRSYSG